jgi:hypothetical protein
LGWGADSAGLLGSELHALRTASRVIAAKMVAAARIVPGLRWWRLENGGNFSRASAGATWAGLRFFMASFLL